MKNLKISMYFIVGLFLCISVFMINSVQIHAATSLKVPEITSFETSTTEKNALNVAIKSNNSGTNYSFELLNTTSGKINILSGNTTKYTYQKLKNGTYSIQIRACTNDKNTYSCTDYSKIKSATLKSNTDLPKPTIKSAQLSQTSFNCDGTQKTPSVTVIDSNNNTLTKDKDYKVTYPEKRATVGTYTVVVKGIGDYSFEKKLSFKIKLATPFIAKYIPSSKYIGIYYTDNLVYFVDGFAGGNQMSYKASSSKKWTNYTSLSGSVPQKGLLKPSTKYDVRIRNYVILNNKTEYSSWSSTVTVKTLPASNKYNSYDMQPYLEKYSYKYNGKNIKPSVLATNGKTKAKLKQGTDYTVSYPKNSKKVGTYTITVKGKGAYERCFPVYLRYRVAK